MPLQPNSMLGPYQIVGILGEGGMGVVYRAKDTRLGRDVAIKVITNLGPGDSERVARFEQEARATGMLNHPNLLTVFDVGHAQEMPYLVSELLEGESLRSRLERGALSPRKAIDAASQIAQGLAAAHEKGVVHRDLKPDNIFLTRDGRVKILDFGIAKLTAPAGAEGPSFAMAATEPGMVLGTVGYMSPEQVRGEQVDNRSDIFSFGAIVYEMLTGGRAFKRDSSIETLGAILKDDPPDLTEILPATPPSLERLVRRCLEKDRDQRFQSARDLAFNLETLSTMATGAGTLSGSGAAARGAGASVPTGSSNAPTATMRPQPPLPTSARPAPTSTPPTAARPRTTAMLTRPKRTISPLLLVLFYLVSIAGAAWGAWKWATRKGEEAPEVRFERVTFRRGEVRGARFMPDGETIVYSAAWDGKPSEIYVASRNATEARPFGLADAEVLAVSRTEAAVLLRKNRLTGVGTLARVPLAGGMPREVADNVLQADWSPDGTNLAVIRVVNGKQRLEYPIGTVKYETFHYIRDVRVSPDGARVAFIEPSKGENEVAVVDKAAPVTIARGWPRGATGLAWRPDGNEIWITGTSTSAPPSLFAIDFNGGTRLVSRLTGSMKLFDISRRGEVLLANGAWRAALVWSGAPAAKPALSAAEGAGGVSNPAEAAGAPQERDLAWLDWSVLADLAPDGKTVLFNEVREGGGAKKGVYLRQVDAPFPVRIGEGEGNALSPDGKWVITRTGPKLVLLPTGTGMARELKIEGSFANGAAWLPDSRRVVVAGAEAEAGYRLFLVDTLDETKKPVTPATISDGGGTVRAFAVSPDGRFIACLGADEKVVVYPIDSSAPAVPLPGAEPGEIPMQWSANNSGIFVYRPTALPAQVFLIDVATGGRTLWREFTPADPAGVYRIAPVLMTPDGAAYAYNALRSVNDLYVGVGLR